MGRGGVGLDLGDHIAAQYLLRQLPAIPGRDETIPAVLLLDQTQLRGEIDGGLGLKTVDYLPGFTIEQYEFDAA